MAFHVWSRYLGQIQFPNPVSRHRPERDFDLRSVASVTVVGVLDIGCVVGSEALMRRFPLRGSVSVPYNISVQLKSTPGCEIKNK